MQAWSGRRREALRRPQREEKGGVYCGGIVINNGQATIRLIISQFA